MRISLTALIQIVLRQHQAARALWFGPLLLVLGLTGIGVVTHALVLSEVAPPISITSADGPQPLPISWLWDRTTSGFEDVKPQFQQRLVALDQQIIERGVQTHYVDRLVKFFWLSILSFISAMYFTLRYIRSFGALTVCSQFVFVVLFPSTLAMLLIYQPNPQVSFRAWTAQHSARSANAPAPPPL